MTRDKLLLAKEYYRTFPPGSWVQVPRDGLLGGIATLEAAWKEAEHYKQQHEEGYGYLSRLLCSVTAPSPCQSLDTLLGIATQIDNYIAGLKRERNGWEKSARKYQAERSMWIDEAHTLRDRMIEKDAEIVVLTEERDQRGTKRFEP